PNDARWKPGIDAMRSSSSLAAIERDMGGTPRAATTASRCDGRDVCAPFAVPAPASSARLLSWTSTAATARPAPATSPRSTAYDPPARRRGGAADLARFELAHEALPALLRSPVLFVRTVASAAEDVVEQSRHAPLFDRLGTPPSVQRFRGGSGRLHDRAPRCIRRGIEATLAIYRMSVNCT